MENEKDRFSIFSEAGESSTAPQNLSTGFSSEQVEHGQARITREADCFHKRKEKTYAVSPLPQNTESVEKRNAQFHACHGA